MVVLKKTVKKPGYHGVKASSVESSVWCVCLVCGIVSIHFHWVVCSGAFLCCGVLVWCNVSSAASYVHGGGVLCAAIDVVMGCEFLFSWYD